ncbi:MAG: hypothetical protein Q8M09_14920 [Pseudomonadota bacterium]|nr:hypothetical protein [Pseudomonadota bacterium]MDP1905516.1 hypothetical protein [Pseudomonadota bacterium]
MNTLFTVDDPFADCLYVKPTLAAAQVVADVIGAGVIVEVDQDDLYKVICRYFRQGVEWVANGCQV